MDIFLPCCKEPTDVPEESIRAALKLEYPSDRFRVLVLDDGSDDDLKAICETLQVETGGHVLYLRRTKVCSQILAELLTTGAQIWSCTLDHVDVLGVVPQSC